ncbi:LysE family translocator [Pontiellaceae bacterium B1224]|nr:LysE family translocator [Pontiellaceae bacterium B1224]
MLDSETILTFWIASTLLALAPGPDNIFVLTQSAVHGKSAGIVTTLGLLTGVMVHTCAVAFGIAALFQTSEVAFSVLKYIGAAYLLYLAWNAFRARGQAIETAGDGRVKVRKLYLRGIIMNVTNPKVSIFFLAFLPQFADPQRGSMVFQFLELGGLFILSGGVVFFGIALLAGMLGDWLNKSPRAQSMLNKIAGVVFVGLALKIATAHR